MQLLALLLVTCSAVWIVAGLVAVVYVTRWRTAAASARSEPPARGYPPVSVLKPLCGADPGLSNNLETFFEQDYPAFELLFGVEDPADPALGVVAALRRRYPQVPYRLVSGGHCGALNRKVANLLGMLPQASADLLLLSDSNVRVPSPQPAC